MSDKIEKFKERKKYVDKKLPKIRIAEKSNITEVPAKAIKKYDKVKSEEEFEVDESIYNLVEKIEGGDILFSDLKPDEKFFVIKHYKEICKWSKDEIAKNFDCKRNVVTNYFKKIKQYNAKKLADTDIWELGGEIHQAAIEAMEGAMKAGKFQQVAYIMSVMVQTLQSMGLIFKSPQRSQVAQYLVKELRTQSAKGYSELKQIADDGAIDIDTVFDELMKSVKEGKLEEK